jgi:hypothetical protein
MRERASKASRRKLLRAVAICCDLFSAFARADRHILAGKRPQAIFWELKMETTLRPMSLGELLDRTAQLYRTHFLLFVGISAVYAGVLLVLNLLQIGLTELLKAMHMGGQQLWVTFGFLLLILPVTVIAAGAAVAANNRAVAWVNVGQPATIRGAYKSILPRLWSYLWLMFLTTVIILTPFIVIYGGFLLFMWKYGAFNLAKTQKADPYAVMVIGGVSILFFILIVAWIVYAILMGLRYSLAVPASVVENLKARKAMRRSIELSKGSRGRIFLLGLMISFIQLGLVAISQGFFILAAFKNHMVLPVWAQILQQFVGFLTSSFIGPMYATGLTLFYYDQRIRKEGYDIEWMMEAAGLSWPPPWAGIDPATAQSAPGAVAMTPGAGSGSSDTLAVEVEVPAAEAESTANEGAATPEPAAEEPATPTPPGVDHDRH